MSELPSWLFAPVVVVCAVASLGLAAPAGATGPDPRPHSYSAAEPAYEAISHRGARGRHLTENGLGALHQAHAEGADRVELDVRPTRDGHLVVMHDSTLNRTTRCSGQVARRTAHWIARHCRLNDGGPVPLLSTFVAEARTLGQPLMVELKAAPGWRPVVMRRLRAILVHDGHADQQVVISFSRGLLRKARAYLPTVERSWIVNRGAPSPAMIRAVAPNAQISVRYLTPAVVARYDRAGIAIYGRVNNSPSAWRRFANLHLRGSLADNIHGLVAWKDAHLSPVDTTTSTPQPEQPAEPPVQPPAEPPAEPGPPFPPRPDPDAAIS